MDDTTVNVARDCLRRAEELLERGDKKENSDATALGLELIAKGAMEVLIESVELEVSKLRANQWATSRRIEALEAKIKKREKEKIGIE